MSFRFSELQMKLLADIYKEHECLWNVTNDLYKNRDAREAAYKKICNALQIPGLKPKDVPKKIKNLRSSYCQELKKIAKSIRSGVSEEYVYRPKLCWFTTVDGYLRPQKKKRDAIASANDIEDELKTFDMIPEEISEDECSNTSNDPLKHEPNPTKISSDEEQQPPAVITFSKSPSTKPAKKRKQFRFLKKKKDNDYSNISVLYKLDRIQQTIGTNQKQTPEDEFDVFGKYVAMTLRTLPQDLSIIARTELQQALSSIQLRAVPGHQNYGIHRTKMEVSSNVIDDD